MVEGLGFRGWWGFRVYGSRTAIGTNKNHHGHVLDIGFRLGLRLQGFRVSAIGVWEFRVLGSLVLEQNGVLGLGFSGVGDQGLGDHGPNSVGLGFRVFSPYAKHAAS